MINSYLRPPKRDVLSLDVKDLPLRGRCWLLGELEPPTSRTPPHTQIDRAFQPGSIHSWATARRTSWVAFDGPASAPTRRSISAGNRDKFATDQGRNSVEGDPMPRSEHYALPLGYREVWRSIGQTSPRRDACVECSACEKITSSFHSKMQIRMGHHQ